MLKKINGFWVDKNNNRWYITIYTKEEAKRFSKSLVNCNYCHNCHDCYYCYYCHNCHYCDYCHYCNKCDYCIKCYNCYYCNDCYYCYSCNNYKSNPQRYITDKIDSRDEDNQATFYYGKTKIGMKVAQVSCDCFRGSLEDFEKVVLEKYKDNDLYREQYLKEIEKVKILFELEDK